MDGYLNFVLKRRWLTLVLATLIMVATAAGGRYLSVSDDLRRMFSAEDPNLIAFDALEDTYAASNTALIALAPVKGSVFTRESLAAVEGLTEAAWQVPHSRRVTSLTNYMHSESRDDDLIVEPLVEDALSLTDDQVRRIERIAQNSSDLAGRLVSRDGRVTGIAIDFVMPDDGSALVEVTDALHALLEKARVAHPGIVYHATGETIVNRAIVDAVDESVSTLVPLAFLIVMVGAALLLRSAFSILAVVAAVLYSIVTTLGIAGWFGAILNPTTSGLPVIVMVITVAHSVHIILTALANISRGMDKRTALAESLRSTLWPIFLTSLTTSIGFLSLNASDSPPFRELGNLVALGIVCSFVYCLTLLPAMLALLPLRRRSIETGAPSLFERFGRFVVARHRLLLWAVPILVVALIAGIPLNKVSDNWTKLFDDSYEVRRATDFIDRNLTGVNSIEFSLSSGEEGGITDPEYLRRVDKFAEWLRQQPEVSHVRAFPEIIKRLNRNMNGEDPAFQRIPDSRDLVAQYLLLYELSLPFGSDLNDRIDVGKSATRLTATLSDVAASDLLELDLRAQAWFQANAPDLANRATGLNMVFAHLTKNNIASMLSGTMIGMAIISLILIGIFRSIRMGLISLVPNFVPALMTFGTWGYLVGQIGLSGAVVTVVAFGIIVDDTIHFMTKYRKLRAEGQSAADAIVGTFGTVGPALAVTTIVLSVGFLTFALSGYDGNSTLGIMVTMTILIALVTDFLLLPPLLMVLDRGSAGPAHGQGQGGQNLADGAGRQPRHEAPPAADA